MIIAIDFFKQIKGEGKSIGIYNGTCNIIKGISKEYKKYKNVKIIVFCNSYNVKDIENLNIETVIIDKLNPKNKIHCVLWELFLVNKYIKQYSVDTILFPRGFTSINCPAVDVVLIHDMIPFYYDKHYRGYFNVLENFYIMNRLKYAIRHAKQIITISKESKNEILQYVKTNSNKIHVVYNGMEDIETNDDLSKKDYISAITSKLPHKNAIGIVKSYERYLQISKNPMPITIIGIDACDVGDISPQARSKITFVKYVDSDQELHNIIQESKLFLFLSLIEGFGRPPLEAMKLKTPVVCSNLSALPEIVGDAAILVNPNNYDEVAHAIDKILSDHILSNKLVVNGTDNVDKFKLDDQILHYINILVGNNEN